MRSNSMRISQLLIENKIYLLKILTCQLINRILEMRLKIAIQMRIKKKKILSTWKKWKTPKWKIHLNQIMNKILMIPKVIQ